MMHDFHNMEYVTQWVAHVNNSVRESVVSHIVAHLTLLPFEPLHLVELACGPGILAQAILSQLPHATYEGLDYSAPMLTLAKKRLAPLRARVSFRQADLRMTNWAAVLEKTPNAMISMQALHDVGGEKEHQQIYQIAREILTPGGLFLNADFVRRSADEKGPGRLSIEQHLKLLKECDFAQVKCTLNLGRYGCVVGYV